MSHAICISPIKLSILSQQNIMKSTGGLQSRLLERFVPALDLAGDAHHLIHSDDLLGEQFVLSFQGAQLQVELFLLGVTASACLAVYADLPLQLRPRVLHRQLVLPFQVLPRLLQLLLQPSVLQPLGEQLGETLLTFLLQTGEAVLDSPRGLGQFGCQCGFVGTATFQLLAAKQQFLAGADQLCPLALPFPPIRLQRLEQHPASPSQFHELPVHAVVPFPQFTAAFLLLPVLRLQGGVCSLQRAEHLTFVEEGVFECGDLEYQIGLGPFCRFQFATQLLELPGLPCREGDQSSALPLPSFQLLLEGGLWLGRGSSGSSKLLFVIGDEGEFLGIAAINPLLVLLLDLQVALPHYLQFLLMHSVATLDLCQQLLPFGLPLARDALQRGQFCFQPSHQLLLLAFTTLLLILCLLARCNSSCQLALQFADYSLAFNKFLVLFLEFLPQDLEVAVLGSKALAVVETLTLEDCHSALPLACRVFPQPSLQFCLPLASLQLFTPPARLSEVSLRTGEAFLCFIQLPQYGLKVAFSREGCLLAAFLFFLCPLHAFLILKFAVDGVAELGSGCT